mgnify:CR=1 FL=1
MRRIEICFNHVKDWQNIDIPKGVEPLPRLCEGCALKMIDAFYDKFGNRWYEAKAARVRKDYLKRMEAICDRKT